MKVWFLATGTLVMDRAQILWNAPGGTLVQVPTFGILIEHDDRLVLADTGLDLPHAQQAVPFMQPEQSPDQTILEQLRLCGFSPTDVTTVVNSHLHFDHAGGNRHFPHATVVVHERELAQARSFEPFERYAYSDSSWDHDQARLMPVAGDYELAPGLWLYETPGHSAGHYSLLVEPAAGGRPMLFGFDVVYTGAALEREIQPAFHIDPVAGQRSITRLKALAAEHDAEIYLCHDLEAWNTFKRPPDHYEV